MAPLPTITNVFRCAIEWNGSPIRPVTVFHVESVTTQDVSLIASTLGSTYPAAGGKPFQMMHGNYSASSVLITPLDGHTAGVVAPLGITINGASSGDQILNDAVVVAFQTAQRGPRGRGRVFIGPIAETSQTSGVVDAPNAAATLTGWVTWHAALRTATHPCPMVVASYTHADYHAITGVRVNSKVGSMKRRLDALP
jgi:hypothetical protein